MSPPDSFIREINAQKVAPELLGEVTRLWASLPVDEWNDFDQRLERVVELVGKKHGGEGGPMLAMAVALRLMALDAVVIDPEFRAWLITEQSPDGVTFINGDLLRIAAEQTILEGSSGDPVFDRVAFRTRLMELTATRGSA